MTRALCLSILVLGLGACGAANVTEDPDRTMPPADRATPPERSSLDETDGPTAPRGSAQRPIGEGAGYENDDSGDE
jgi:hypothetical protein